MNDIIEECKPADIHFRPVLEAIDKIDLRADFRPVLEAIDKIDLHVDFRPVLEGMEKIDHLVRVVSAQMSYLGPMIEQVTTPPPVITLPHLTAGHNDEEWQLASDAGSYATQTQACT